MQTDVLNIQGEKAGSIDLDDTVWGIEPHVSVMHQAVVRQQANARLGTHDTKTRGEVRGGGRKPWRQKGTGRARQGTIRAPQWKGGGVVFGPHPRKYTQRMPRQMRRLAIRSALSAKLRDDRVTVVSGLAEVEPKTRAMKQVLAGLPEGRSVLVIMHEKVESIERAASNLEDVKTVVATMLSVRDLLKYDRVIVTEEAVGVIEGLWALTGKKREPSQWKLDRQAAGAAVEEVA
ncbi:MAG TPA: 50S ribosomal protein L4 [Thermomicrobiales bacterium]|jgi:large subunit ribosomal protein L4|nr:50S ribosomal protein L4 [Thermomicrobiales bacterium]